MSSNFVPNMLIVAPFILVLDTGCRCADLSKPGFDSQNLFLQPVSHFRRRSWNIRGLMAYIKEVEAIGQAMVNAWQKNKIVARAHVLNIDSDGVVVE